MGHVNAGSYGHTAVEKVAALVCGGVHPCAALETAAKGEIAAELARRSATKPPFSKQVAVTDPKSESNFGLTLGQHAKGCVVILEVRHQSAAWWVDLKAGDYLAAVDGHKVSSAVTASHRLRPTTQAILHIAYHPRLHGEALATSYIGVLN